MNSWSLEQMNMSMADYRLMVQLFFKGAAIHDQIETHRSLECLVKRKTLTCFK
jgi:hypothetical protein